jgi:LPS export ABC transporter protein LptC/lipopolysaccharide transport protein LptA
MPVMTDLEPRQRRQPHVGATSNAIERSKHFRAANRHTRIVKGMRWALPVAALLIAAGYMAAIGWQAGWHKDVAKVVLPKILPADLTMNNPNYEGYGDDGSKYKFAAKTAKPDLKNTDIIHLNDITGELFDPKKVKTDVTAARGVFNSKTGILELSDSINIDSANGLKARLTQATLNSKSALIVSKQPVKVAFPAGTIQSKEMTIRQKKKIINFIHDVRANLKPPPKKTEDANTADQPAPAAATKQPASMFAASDEPVQIRSTRLTVRDNDKRATFIGDVKAKQGAATLTTPELDVNYDAGGAADTDKADPPAPAAMGLSGGKIRRIIAKGPVVMTQNKNDKVTCEAAEFDAINETAILSGNVIMTSGPTRSAKSDRVDLDQAKEIAILTGNVVIKQDKNILRGRRLVVERAIGRTTLTSPPALGAGPGRISATLVQANAAKKKKTEAPPRTGPAGGFRTDPSKPLDITADQLVVEDKKKQAIFRGNVLAKQGQFKISAARITATYSGSAALGDVGGGKTQSSNDATNLKKVRAEKKVVITGGKDQSVEGDWAEFDVAGNTAVVGGDVRLKQNGAVIQGTRLTIDTKTGQSTIDTAPRNTSAKPSGGGWVTKNADGSNAIAAPSNSGRPSAVFFLNQLGTKKGKRKPAKKTPKGTSSWEPRTSP